MSLILHCGAESITRSELGELPVPQPLGSRHVIRPFIDDVEVVDHFLTKEGYRISDEAFGVKFKDDAPADFFGVITVEPKAGSNVPAGTGEYSLQIGIRGSYVQRMPRSLAVGNTVFACDNMAFSAEITVSTKQTLNIAERIPALLGDAIARLPRFAKHQTQRVASYKGKHITGRIGDAMLVECVRRGILPPSLLGKAISEWDEPSHEEHGERSVWTLYNAVTEALKQPSGKSNILPLWERTIPLTALFDKGVGLAVFN